MRRVESLPDVVPWRARTCAAIAVAVVLVLGGRGATVTAAQANSGSGPALKIVVIEGEAGVNIIDQKTAVAPVVEVRNRNDLPVVGAQVTFLIRSGAGRATLNNGLRQVTVATNAAGRATVAVNPISNGAIQLQVNAAYQGQTAAATITQTNFATAAQAASASSAGSGGAGGGGGGAGAGAGAGAGTGAGLSTAAIAGIAGAAVGGAVAATQLAGGDDGGGGDDPLPCSFSLSQTSVSAGASGGSTGIAVTASPSGCTNGGWTASSNAAFVTVSPTSGNGSGNVTVTVAANTGGVSRTATVTIANLSVSVTQGQPCAFTVSPTSAGPLANTGGSVSIAVTASPSGCTPATWTAASNAAFLTVSPTSGSGAGNVTVTASANTGGTTRSGTVTIAGQTVTVSQGTAIINLTGTWLGSSPAAPPGTEPLRISISHPAGSSSFTVSSNFTSGGSTFTVTGTGTISGTSVRIDTRATSSSPVSNGTTLTCTSIDSWNMTVNAAGTQMSGQITGTFSCNQVIPPTSGSGTGTLTKQ